MFANLVEEGSWVDAVIDEAQPERTPLPKADIRKMARPIGPVAVFTASNFPLAFSTAGGDTASALASGCPVIVKAHPSHLGTNSLVSEAINNAIARCNLPGGIYSTLIGGIDVGTKLVSHKSIAAVAFTGSFNGGKALFDIATKRETPIPVYAEMGSVNPIFILPNKMATENKILADKIANSINLGAGQFCTNPGLIIVEKGKDTDAFLSHLKKAFEGLVPATMLNEGINNNFIANKNKCSDQEGVETLANQENNINDWKGYPGIATVVAKNFIVNPKLQEEIFGPFTLVVMCESKEQMINVAAVLHGQLTGTIFSDEREISGYEGLFDLLSEKVGRLIFNGVPTGVEVCPAMHHGGPYPASTNAMFTSVGTDAIKRFVKPVCYQDVPQSMLPVELLASNPLQIWRKVNGKLIK
jgi:NADP-dependent aldehyde dehydrogenase